MNMKSFSLLYGVRFIVIYNIYTNINFVAGV